MCFKLAINMPGSVSAGAYTAGVLDYLTEALDAWYAAKRNRDPVPAHDVSIEAFTGASAGGMCAAISSVLLQDRFEHITDTSRTGTTNRYFESWVNRIDLSELLKTTDLSGSPESITSLLDSSIIESIAAYAIRRVDPLPEPRPYVSPRLTLFLSLTNLGGVPYSLHGPNSDPAAHTSVFHGDRIRFETKRAVSHVPLSPIAHPIDLSGETTDASWGTLRAAAMATGAFPALLAPRTLQRFRAEYQAPVWESLSAAAQKSSSPESPSPVPPGVPDAFETLNIDGGVTNNDPFSYAVDFLSSLEPALPENKLPGAAAETDRAIISVAPISNAGKYPTTFDGYSEPSIIQTLPRLLRVLISQSRFSGEPSNQLLAGTTYSSFSIAPSDDRLTPEAGSESSAIQPLQCASLFAFGGFFERGFRAHDFALGRRNCQKFLRDHFILPISNPLVAAGLPADPALRDQILLKYGRPAPTGEAPGEWLPVIPLCGTARDIISAVPRFQMTERKLEVCVELILKRCRALSAALLKLVPSFPLRTFLRLAQPVIAQLAKRPLRNALHRHLCGSPEVRR